VYNTSFHSVTGVILAIALFGFNPQGPNDIPLTKKALVDVPSAKERAKRLQSSREQLVSMLQHS
jgi:hypothetical protein